jgi:hypothetical protein
MANLGVNDDNWEALDPSAQQRIKQIIVDSRMLDADDIISIDPTAPKTDQIKFALPDSVCKAGCIAAEAVAVGVCNFLPSPIEVIACIAVARAAGEFCKSKCASKPSSP